MHELIEGHGGKGGGGGRAPVERRDTLQSKQTIKLLFAVSEGEIDGIEDVLLNKISISEFDATLDWRPGTLNQEPIPNFVTTEAPHQPFAPAQLMQGINHDYAFPSDVDAVRLTLQADALRRVLENGDIVGITVEIEVFTRQYSGASWVQHSVIEKRGKASSPYAWDVVIERPPFTPADANWQMRLVRLTNDDSGIKRASVTRINGITTLRYQNLSYPGTALVAITLSEPDQFGNTIPDVRFKIRGKKVKIPNNYNPLTRTYSGTWDLGMTDLLWHYTSNPAWHIYHVLTDSVCGLGIAPDEIDRVSFYELSQYCDVMLLNASTNGVEPRYALHNQFYTRENAPTFLSHFLSICNAMFSHNGLGQLTIVFDRPGMQPSKLVTNANVVDGMFNYSSSDLDKRYSQVNVTYNNKYSYGETDTVTVTDDALLDRYGLQITDVVLPGCVNEAQAIRKARWVLYTNGYTTELVSFKTLLGGMMYRVGEVIQLMDSDNAGVAQHGKVAGYEHAGGNGTLTLDRTIDLNEGPFTISYLDGDGVTVREVTIAHGAAVTDAVSFSGPDHPAFIGGAYILSGAIQSKLFRVVAVSKDDQEYTVTAAIYDEAKFDYVESGILVPPPAGDFVSYDRFLTPPVTDLAATENSFSDGASSVIQLLVTWNWQSDDAYRAGFVAIWRRDDQSYHAVNEIAGHGFDIDNAVPGVYEITVWAVNPFSGTRSAPSVLIKEYRTEAGGSTLEPPINVRVTGTAGLEFDTPDLSLSFDYDPANEDKSDALLNYLVELWDVEQLARAGTFMIAPLVESNGGQFHLPFVENGALFGQPTRQFIVKIYSRDLTGYLSLPAQVTVDNPVPPVVSFALTQAMGAAYVRVYPPADADIAGYQIWRGDMAEFDKNESSLVYDGPDTYVSINGEQGQHYYYAVAAYDTFGKSNLNVSGEQSGSTLSVNVDTWSKTGIEFSVNAAENTVSWTGGTVLKNAETEYSVVPGSAEWQSGILYVYFNAQQSPTVLQTTTVLSEAVVVGSYPLATYSGGSAENLKGGDGSAFVSGSQLIAGSVGATQLMAGQAVITGSAQIAAGLINNAHIGDFIQSNNYLWSGQNYDGWRIDKSGFAQFKDIAIRRADGGLVFASGSGFDWNNVTGDGVPQKNATRNVFRGQWATSTSYESGDIVIGPDGIGWISKSGHLSGGGNVLPTPPATSNARWEQYLAKGEKGDSGDPGIPGLNAIIVQIYRRATSTPALPSAGTTYNFSTKVLTGLNNGWTTTVPSGSAPLYVSAATATSTTSSASIAAGAWASPVIMAKDGVPGADGVDGSAGANARSVDLTASAQAVEYNSQGNRVGPSSITFTATPKGTSSTVYYRFYVNDVAQGGNPTTVATFIYSTSSTYNSAPVKIEVEIREGTSTGPVVARDQMSVYSVKPGVDSITAILSNEAHTVPADASGSVLSYAGSGTNIVVYEGTELLIFDSVSASFPTINGRFRLASTATGIVRGSVSGQGTSQAAIADHGSMSQDTAQIVYTLRVRTLDGKTLEITKTQTFSKSRRGADGSNGAPGDTVDIIFRRAASLPATPNPSAGVPSGWFSNVSAVTGTGSMWSCVGKKLSGASNYTWQTPVLIEGSDGEDGANGQDGFSIAELLIFRRGSSAPATPSGGSYNFSTKTITPPSQWSATIPAVNGQPLYTSRTVASSQNPTATVSLSGWTAPVLSIKDGEDGFNTATVLLFRRTTTPTSPSGPSSTVTYTFATGASTAAGNSWQRTLPTTGGEYRWMISATALGTGATDTIATGEWSAPALLAEGGAKTFSQSTAPTNANTGDIWYDTSTRLIKRYTGSTWTTVGTNPVTNSGSGAPGGSGVEGDAYFDTSTGLMWYYQNGWKKVMPKIGAPGGPAVSTFIEDAAIGQAQIANLAVGLAQIQNASITNLKLVNNHICRPLEYHVSGSATATPSEAVTIGTLSWTSVHGTDRERSVLVTYNFEANNVNIGHVRLYLDLDPYNGVIERDFFLNSNGMGSRHGSGSLLLPIPLSLLQTWANAGYQTNNFRVRILAWAAPGSTVPIEKRYMSVMEIIA